MRPLFNTALPLIQAPMAGVQDWRLAAAVCAAGGLGSVPAGMLDAAGLEQQLAQLSAATDSPFQHWSSGRFQQRFLNVLGLYMLAVNVIECTVVGLRDYRGVPVGTPALIDHPRHQAISDHADTVGVGDSDWAINQSAFGEPCCARHFSRCI